MPAKAQIILGQNHKIPWVFIDFLGVWNFPDQFAKFPDFSLTLNQFAKFPDFSLTLKKNQISLISGHPAI